jgi:hypothetical protein
VPAAATSSSAVSTIPFIQVAREDKKMRKACGGRSGIHPTSKCTY